MRAKEYIEEAVSQGIDKPVYFRGSNWESVEMTLHTAIEYLSTVFSDLSSKDINLLESGIDADFPSYMVVYFD